MKEVAPGLFVDSTYAPYNLVLVRTSRGGILVDLPPNPMHALDWIGQARAVLGELRCVIMTDARRERQFAMATGLRENLRAVPIVATTATRRVMQGYDEERPRREFLDEIARTFPDAVTAIENPLLRKPELVFGDAVTLYATDRVLQLRSVAGAASGSLWVLVKGEGILIAGDTVVAETVPLMDSTPDSKAWLNTMTGLSHQHDVQEIIPGRGQPIIPVGEIEPQREFMRVMRRAARTLARKGEHALGLVQTSQELGQTFYNRQGQKAVKQIKAGLENLIIEVGRMEATDPEGGG
jgi:glyoxylase-like metal-dependent hydrolase (beta-lactamase superfamily II)